MAPDVINNSWSCPLSEGCDPEHIAYLKQVVENVRTAGIMVVVSAGNGGGACGTVDEPPAMYDATYAVGATLSNDDIASFSSRGTGTGLLKPDISAPGVVVLSSIPGTGYSFASGTSMASPHVVGAISLLWSAAPDLRGHIQATENIFNSSAVPRYSTQCGDPLQTVPNNVYGWGRIDAFVAVQSVVGTLSGSVRDESGEGISLVAISAELDTGLVRNTYSDAEGFYKLYPVSGVYTVTFSKPAYVTQVIANVVITAGQTTMLPVIMPQYSFFVPVILHGS
jgi:subtilisin family serine protease